MRATVIGKALDILSRIHAAITAEEEQSQVSPDTEDVALEDAKRRRILHALLDLVSLEGIYPSLSTGVGIPLQQRVISVLPAGVIAKQSDAPSSGKPHDELLLDRILLTLSGIILDTRPSIQPVVRGRILSDIISGSLDLAFNSKSISAERRDHYQNAASRAIEEYVLIVDLKLLHMLRNYSTPSSVLLSTLSAFLQSETAPWFKAQISGYISRVPLRHEGVLQTILFVTSQFAPSLGREAQNQASNGPHFTVQAIMHVSRLLSSVPQDMDPVAYLSAIAPQLLSLLDGDDPDLKKTASYVVGSGILGKRAYGAPGKIGHMIFVEPIFKALTAERDASARRWLTTSGDASNASSGKALTDGFTLHLAIDRLKTLTLQHPNPGLVKRLVYPILVPLWGLASFAKEQQQTTLHESVMALLQTYFAVSVGVQPLKKLVDHFLWNGGPTWTYGVDAKGQVSLKKRDPSHKDQFNVIKLVDSLQSRIEMFVRLLGSDPSSEERTGDIFLCVSENWLVKDSSAQRPLDQLQLPSEKDESEAILQKLVSAKLAEKLLDNFKDTLSRRPLRVLELIKHIIDGESGLASTRTKTKNASLASLANIVNKDDEEKPESSTENDSTESLSTAFSLLSTVLASPEFAVSNETRPVLESIKTQLDLLVPHLPSSLTKPATTSSMLLEIHLTSPEHIGAKQTSPNVSDLDTHRQALTNLISDLPPVQAEGFSLLSNLIKKSSPVLDIPSTLTLLLSIITNESESAANEDFIYLNAIKLIGTLASRHPRTVVKTLVNRYTDNSETATLDQRLKIGESLLRTVQDLGEALTGETAKILGEAMISVAGRRGHKPQAQKARREQLEREKRQQEREARRKEKENAMPPGWNITSASITEELGKHLQEHEDEDEDTETPEQNAHAANIISAWAAGSKSDEEPDDLRVRASALSTLASAVQTNLAGLGSAIASSAVDLALATLTLEPDAESAILRRASVVLLLDILKALDTARETRGSTGLDFGFSLSEDSSQGANYPGRGSIGNLPHMLRTLHFVEGHETDSIVRGHIRVLIESLEAWTDKSLLWGIGARGRDEEENEPRFELGDRIAGLSVDPLAGRSARPRIEEIE